MKKLLFTLVLIVVAAAVQAQSSSAIFSSRADFIARKPSFLLEPGSVLRVRGNGDIVATYQGQRTRFKASFIEGYSDGKNRYRNFDRGRLIPDQGYYKVLYDSGVVVYSKLVTDFRGNKKTYFYYSLDFNSPILPLKRRYYHSDADGRVILQISKLKEAVLYPAGAPHIHISIPVHI